MSRQSRKLVILLIVIELYFMLPLLVCGLAWYEAIRAMRQSEVSKATLYTKLADPFFQLANSSYKLTRPALWILQLSDYTDRAMSVAGYVNRTALAGTEATRRIHEMLPLVTKTDKTADDQRTLNKTMNYLRETMPQITNNLLILSLETQNPQLRDLHAVSKFFNVLILESDEVGGNKKAGKFLILFLNDKELRPGGGFIGSYGVVTFGHYSLQNIEIHDVYDADGQLREHIDPPPAVRTYLQNPHWFLRDSNFSPDFKENARRAEWFLERELGAPQQYDGVIGITTTMIENIIGAYGEIALPGTGEIITKENFYEKTQETVHQNFFPGSRQKQSTLAELSQALLINFNGVSKEALGAITKEMLRQKQLVVYMKNDRVQSILEEYGWAGTFNQEDDYIYPVEANVGVNKVNAWVKRESNLEVRVSPIGALKHIYNINFSNTYSGADPGNNIYKNYFQIFVPKGSQIISVLADGRSIAYEIYTQNNSTVPSVYIEIPPQSSKKLTVIYNTPNTVKKEIDSMYRLTVHKQIGIPSSESQISVTLPKGSSLVSKNYEAEIRGSTVKHTLTIDENKPLELKFITPE